MKYVVAVSGGVDSVVLLHMLKNNYLAGFSIKDQFVVAHFDHGIREESARDADFVEELAQSYGFVYECGSANLGPGASEDAARQMRYNFLRQCSKKYNASAIVLAHHQDDQVETAIINVIRGTSWRGFSSLQSNSELQRPLLAYSKQDLLAYAKEYGLSWVEDATNTDQTYLRNYIRHTLIPSAEAKDPMFKQKMLRHVQSSTQQRVETEAILHVILSNHKVKDAYHFSRYNLIMLPRSVARELIYATLTLLDPEWHPSAAQIERVLHFCKTSLIAKRLQVSKGLIIESKTRHLEFKKY